MLASSRSRAGYASLLTFAVILLLAALIGLPFCLRFIHRRHTGRLPSWTTQRDELSSRIKADPSQPWRPAEASAPGWEALAS